MCELRHTSVVVQKMQRGQKNPMELAIIWVRAMLGSKRPSRVDGRGKLAERITEEARGSAPPALHHRVEPNSPWSLCPRARSRLGLPRPPPMVR